MKKFIGVYRDPKKPNQRMPIYQTGSKYFDLLGREVDFSKLILVVEPK